MSGLKAVILAAGKGTRKKSVWLSDISMMWSRLPYDTKM